MTDPHEPGVWLWLTEAQARAVVDDVPGARVQILQACRDYVAVCDGGPSVAVALARLHRQMMPHGRRKRLVAG